MNTRVASNAFIDPSAKLAPDVVVGPFSYIGAGVEIGAGSIVMSNCWIYGDTIIGENNKFYPGSSIGLDPQDLKYKGERTKLVIGNGNVFREFVTVHRGTEPEGTGTVIGDNNLFMAYTHVAHDCKVGNNCIFVNGATLAGHVEVGNFVVISAFSAVHQFCRVGSYAYIGAYSIITQDVIPFVKVAGQRPACYGVNSIGLQRRGITKETIRKLEKTYKIIMKKGKRFETIISEMEKDNDPFVKQIVHFIKSTKRGILRKTPSKTAGRR